MWIRERWKPLLAVAVLVLGAVAYVGQERWRERCGAAVSSLDADDLGSVLTPRDDLPAEVVERLDGLGAPFGPVVAGVTAESDVEVPTVGALDEQQIYVAGAGGPVGTGYDGSVAVVDAASGQGQWGVGVRGYGVGGGPVGDSFVLLGIPEDKAPEVAAYDLGSGDREGCTKLGEDVATGFAPPLSTVEVGGGEVVVARPDDSGRGGLAITRLDPRSGEEAWTVRADHTAMTAVLDDAGEVLVLSDVPRSRSASSALEFADESRPIRAFDTSDGAAAWTWPEDRPGIVGAKVVGTDRDAGISYLIEVTRGTREGTDDAGRLVAVDASAAEVWAQDLAGDYCDAGRWGDLVVASCGEPPLVAFDAATGEPRWSSPTDIDIVGGVLRVSQTDRSVDLGDGTRLVPANDGLWRVDTATGEITVAVSEEEVGGYVSGIEVVGDRLVLVTDQGAFVMERERS